MVRAASFRRQQCVGIWALFVGSCGQIGYDPYVLPAPECTSEWVLVGPVPGVNAVGVDDWGPFVSTDGMELFFSSWRSGNADLWVARRSSLDEVFGTPEPLVGVNDDDFQGSPALGPDGTLYYIAHSPHVTDELDVWSARQAGVSSFAEASSLNDLSANGDETDVDISRAGLTAYVTSERTGRPSIDVWRATRSAIDEPFGSFELVEELSSEHAETSVTISPDELEIVIASDRPGGIGGLDLWIATRESADAPFDPPVLLEALSSAGDDSKPSFGPDGLSMYFNYDADEHGGEDADIWLATRCRR